MARLHEYRLRLDWTGGAAGGTTSYAAYSREHAVAVADKAQLRLSSDPHFAATRPCTTPKSCS